MSEPLRFNLTCHGEINPVEPLTIIPDNIKIVTFTNPSRISSPSKESTFIFYALKYGNSFIKEFGKALYYYNLNLYNLSEKKDNPTTIYETESITDLKTNYIYHNEIFQSILNAGKDDCTDEQSIQMFGRGLNLSKKISNYKLSKSKNEYSSVTMKNDKIDIVENISGSAASYLKRNLITSIITSSDISYDNSSIYIEYAQIYNPTDIRIIQQNPKKRIIGTISNGPNMFLVYINNNYSLEFLNPTYFPILRDVSKVSPFPTINYFNLPDSSKDEEVKYNIFKENIHLNYTKSLGIFLFNPDYDGDLKAPEEFMYASSCKYGYKTYIDDITTIIEENVTEPTDKDTLMIANYITYNINKEINSTANLSNILTYFSNYPETNFVLFLNCCKNIRSPVQTCPELSLLQKRKGKKLRKVSDKPFSKSGRKYSDTEYYFSD
jgi:hypothetical protein